MRATEITLRHHGPLFRYLTEARLNGHTVHGSLDYPPYPETHFSDHFVNPTKPRLPGVWSLSLMFQTIYQYCQEVTGGRLFPLLTGMPFVDLVDLARPETITVQAHIHQTGYNGIAECHTWSRDKRRASASFTFQLVSEDPKIFLPLPMTFENLTSNRERGSIVGYYQYSGQEVIPLNQSGLIPFWAVLEGLCQNGIQAANIEPSLAKANFVVTYLLGTDFRRMAPVGRLDFRTEVSWEGKFGHVLAAARTGRKPVVSGEFGFAILGAG